MTIDHILKSREPVLKLRAGIDPRSPIQMIGLKDQGQEREFKSAVAENWKEKRRIRRNGE